MVRGIIVLVRSSVNINFVEGQTLPHRRKVNWYSVEVPRASMSEKLQQQIRREVTLTTGSVFVHGNVSARNKKKKKFADYVL